MGWAEFDIAMLEVVKVDTGIRTLDGGLRTKTKVGGPGSGEFDAGIESAALAVFRAEAADAPEIQPLFIFNVCVMHAQGLDDRPREVRPLLMGGCGSAAKHTACKDEKSNIRFSRIHYCLHTARQASSAPL